MTNLRKIDHLIAEHVMGWRSNQPDTGVWYNANAGDSLVWRAMKATWRPSENIGAAWQVVEHLFSQGIELLIAPYAYGGVYEVEARQHGCEVEGTLSRDASAPLAICLAALKVVGVELPAPVATTTSEPAP